MTTTVNSSDILSGANGSFSATVSSLSPNTKYYYKAYMQVWNGSAYVDIESTDTGSFTTTAASTNIPTGWLELPATTGNADYVGTFYGSGGNTEANRNYSYNYSYTYYASLWTAYPLTAAHKSGNASTSSWKYNPNIPQNKQVNMTGNSYPTMYNASNYSKGHQCPNADRKSDDTMNAQTYYCTNQTPQLQSGFNGTIWSALENAERSLATGNETIYVITGPVYRTVGGNETIQYLTGASGQNANPASLPVPNYYFKAFLKVKWNGDEVQSASTIGFWFEHKQYDNSNYASYACSVDFIEQKTGFDLFTNLPGDNNSGIEKTAEANDNWSTFQSF